MPDDMLTPPDANNLTVEYSSDRNATAPFAARFSYEPRVIPHRKVADIAKPGHTKLDKLTQTCQRQAKRYNVLIRRSAPDTRLIHNARSGSKDPATNRHWHYHIEQIAMQPPLRDPEQLNYPAEAKAGTNSILNPLQPEHAALQLCECEIN